MGLARKLQVVAHDHHAGRMITHCKQGRGRVATALPGRRTATRVTTPAQRSISFSLDHRLWMEEMS